MKFKFPSLILITVSAFTLFMASCGGGDAVELKLNVAKGDTYACHVNIDQKVNTSAMGINMKIDQVMEINQTLSVDDVKPDGNVVFKNVMDRFYMKQSMPMMPQPIEFDTDHPEKGGTMGTMGPYFAKMKGLAYTLEMDNHGKLVSSNMDEVYAKLGLDSLTQQGGGGNHSSSNADQYLNQLPDKAIKVGDTYVIEKENSGFGSFGLKSTYTVKEITEALVKLDVKTEFIKGKAQTDNFYSDIKGDQSGTIDIDRKTGMTLKSEVKQNLEMTITASGMEMPMKTNSTVTFTCGKK